MELRGKTVLVTGGAARIGRVIALECARRGAHVGITFLTSSAQAAVTAEEVRDQGVRAVAMRCDQRDPAQIAAVLQAMERELGPVQVLVNNASRFAQRNPERVSPAEWDDDLAVNLRGPWLFMQQAGFAMKCRGEGVIVNLLDVAVERPFLEYLPYCAARAGLLAVTRGMARLLAPEVRVCGVAPGAISFPEEFPPAARDAYVRRTPLGRLGTPEDVAAAVLYLVEAGDYLTGVVIPVDGGRSLT